MSEGSKEAIEALAAIVKAMNLKQELSEISYRIDYQDYQVVFDETHHIEIREKLIEDYMRTKDEDALREMQYLLNHLIAWEEWENPNPPSSKKGTDDGMQIDQEL